MCCWLAAFGAGLLKSEEILEGAARLRISNDIEFEEHISIALMNEARERRAKLSAATPSTPTMVARAEKALEAIYVCCFGMEPIEDEDERLLNTILKAVSPSIRQPEMERIVKDQVRKVAEGSDEINYPEPKPLPNEAVQRQMKELPIVETK